MRWIDRKALAYCARLMSLLVCVSVPWTLTSISAAMAQSTQPVTVYIGTSAGGGYDLYGRLVARHLGRFLPNHPAVVADNMPGAGAVIMTNWLYNSAPKDGTAIGLVPTTTAFEGLLGDSYAKYDARKFNWLGSLSEYTTIAVVWGKSPYKSARDIFDKPIVIGGSGAASDVTVWPRLINSLFGAHLKIVTGYVGTSQIDLAMENGEVQGVIGADWQGLKLSKPDWVRESKVRVLMQFGDERIPELSTVPTAFELAKNETTRKILSLFSERQKYGRSFAAPPGTPVRTVEDLRKAFNQMTKDPEFLADAEKLNATIDYATGEDVQDLVDKVYSTPPDVLKDASEELANASK